MKDLGSFGPQPDMIYSQTSRAASLTLRGWAGKGDRLHCHQPRSAATDSAGSQTINSFSLENLTLSLIIRLL